MAEALTAGKGSAAAAVMDSDAAAVSPPPPLPPPGALSDRARMSRSSFAPPADPLGALDPLGAGAPVRVKKEPAGVFGAAVQRRAGTLAAEYERGARKLDTEYGTTPPGADGPCLQRLRGFGDIAAFVLGASGEVSKDFERWVACVAATRAAAMRRIMGARTDVQARGCIAWRVRRRVGWAAFIAAAQLKICLLYTSPSPRDATLSRMPSSA